MIPAVHTKKTMDFVREKTNEVLVFYSGGKDSLVMLDYARKNFDRVVCVFMYFVKGLEHIEKYLRYAASFPNVEVVQFPHWILSTIHKEGIYCKPTPSQKLLKLSDVVKAAKNQTGIDWIFMGMKQSDSMNRRLMLRSYTLESINEKSGIVYPLSRWSKGDVLSYIKINQLPMPINYGVKQSKSSGMVFSEATFLFLRKKYPQDLEKIYTAYPMSRQILFEYDYRQKTEPISERD